MANSVTSQLDMRELFKTVAECLRKVIKCDGIGMTILDEESGLLRVHTVDKTFPMSPPVAEGGLFPIEGTPAEIAFKSLQTVMVTREFLETSKSPVVRGIAAQGILAGCVAPFVSHGRALERWGW